MNTFKGAKMNLSKFNVWREGMGNENIRNTSVGDESIRNTSVGGESMENDLKLSQFAKTLEALIDRKVAGKKIASGDPQLADTIISIVNSLLKNTKYNNGLSSAMAMRVAKGIRKV